MIDIKSHVKKIFWKYKHHIRNCNAVRTYPNVNKKFYKYKTILKYCEFLYRCKCLLHHYFIQREKFILLTGFDTEIKVLYYLNLYFYFVAFCAGSLPVSIRHIVILVGTVNNAALGLLLVGTCCEPVCIVRFS